MTEKYCNLDDDELEKLMAAKLTPHRLAHSHAVARRARELAEKFGADPERACFAGLVHDICKCDPVAEQLQTAMAGDIIPDETERKTPAVLHQFAGAVFIVKALGVTDREIVDAVRWHCTGKAGMSALEKVIYLADLSSADRKFPDVERTRQEIARGLAPGMTYCTAKVREHLLACGFTLSSHEEECFAQYNSAGQDGQAPA